MKGRAYDTIVELQGLKYHLLCPTSFMQNHLGFANSIKSGVFYAPLADIITSFVDIRYIETVAVEALTKNGRENRGYNITDPEAVSNYDIANTLSEKDQIHQIEIVKPLHGAL